MELGHLFKGAGGGGGKKKGGFFCLYILREHRVTIHAKWQSGFDVNVPFILHEGEPSSVYASFGLT